MDFFEVVNKRRSIRRFTEEKVPESVIIKALEAALLAPNSSNTQTWDFYWVQSLENKKKLVQACLSQSAARTAQELIVVVADPKLWKRSQKPLVEFVRKIQAPKDVILYYEKLIPIFYRWGIFNSLALMKWLSSNIVGLFRPMVRSAGTKRDLQEVAIKSAALAAENLVLALAAQGFASCMMEGFDEFRARRILKLNCSARIVMVIGIGREAEKGTWGPRFRIPFDEVVKKI